MRSQTREMEDEPRRRSNSVTNDVNSQHGRGYGSKASVRTGNSNSQGIQEESDTGMSESDLEMDDYLRSDEELDDDEETGLTHQERRKRRRRKRKNTKLDERIVGDNDDGKAEVRLANATLMRIYFVNACLICLWYSFSISISVYNKWMFSKDNLDFHYPLFTTSLHMLVQFSLASAVLYFIPRFRPSAGQLRPVAHDYRPLDGNDESETDQKPSDKPLMTRWFYLTRIGPCGTATALDIGLGNFSLRFISLTFFTMCKSSVLLFVLLFAFIFRLESPSWKIGGIILMMTAGVVMMVAGETAFDALGFILVMTASLCSGFRWSLTQILLLRNPATSNPFSSIFFLTPVMFAALFILAMPIEGPVNLVHGFRILAETKGIFLGICIMLFPGFLAFLMVAAEFALLKRTSVVTLSVCGIFKEVLTISAAGVVFGDELSPINVSGLVVTIASIAGYNYLKYTKMRSQARKEAQQILEDEPAPPLLDSGERSKDVSPGHGHERRESTSALIRNSLSVVTNVPGDARYSKANGVLGNGYVESPTKRPEDHE